MGNSQIWGFFGQEFHKTRLAQHPSKTDAALVIKSYCQLILFLADLDMPIDHFPLATHRFVFTVLSPLEFVELATANSYDKNMVG